jgi:hypothetical protein
MPTAPPLISFLRIRVVNWITGAVITENLPHLPSTWEIRGFQAGAQGQNMLGKFTIPLPPPQSREYRAGKAVFDQLDYGLRVEAYISQSGVSQGGDPRYAGFITSIRKNFDTFEISGSSDLWLLQESTLFPSEGISSLTGDINLRWYGGPTAPLLLDDFNPYVPGNYTQVGTWVAATTPAPTALPGVSCTPGGTAVQAYNFRNTKFYGVTLNGINRPYGMLWEAFCVLNTTSQSTINAGQIGIILSHARDTLGRDAHFASAVAKWNTSTSLYDIDLYINFVDPAGVETSVVTTNAFTSVRMPWTVHVQYMSNWVMQNQHAAVTSFNGKVLQDGLNSAVFFQDGAFPGFFVKSAADGLGGVTGYFANLCVFAHTSVNNAPAGGDGQDAQHTQTSPFLLGSYTQSPNSIALGIPPYQAANQETCLDTLHHSATLDGYVLRYTPQALGNTPLPISGMLSLGTLDYGPTATVTSDLTDTVIFTEGYDLLSCEIEPNAELFTTTARVAGTPGGDSGGSVDWRNIAAIRKYGFLVETVMGVAFAGFPILALLGKAIVGKRTTLASGTAKTITIIRTADNAERWRELDRISIKAPSLGLNNTTSTVVAYTFTEGSAEQTLTLDQYPLSDPQHGWSRYLSGLSYISQQFASR